MLQTILSISIRQQWRDFSIWFLWFSWLYLTFQFGFLWFSWLYLTCMVFKVLLDLHGFNGFNGFYFSFSSSHFKCNYSLFNITQLIIEHSHDLLNLKYSHFSLTEIISFLNTDLFMILIISSKWHIFSISSSLNFFLAFLSQLNFNSCTN